MIIDVHNHINTEDKVKPLLKGGKEVTIYKDNVPVVTPRVQLYQIDERVEGMDQAGIDVTMVYYPQGWEGSLEDCKNLNDYIGTGVKKFPRRLVGTAHIPPLGGEKAYEELRRCVEELGFKAVLIGSSLDGIPLDSSELSSFYRNVTRLDIPVFVHPSMPMDYKLCRDYDLQRILGREFDLMLNLTRMIYGGVFEEFPNLKMVFSHLGGGISGLKGRLKRVQSWLNPSKYMKKSFDDYFNLIYFDTAGFPFSANEIKCALINIGPDRLLFGTDYPADYNNYHDIKKFKDIVQGIPMSEADKIKIMGNNAVKLLKL